jgi:branched-chain amino acid transport system ATP-binding protein
MDSGILTVTDLRVRLGGLTVLDGINVSVPQGTVVGLIGPNGAGKTTVFNAICGLVPVVSGQIAFNGESLRGVRPHRLAGLGISRTLQGVGLFASMTVRENVMSAHVEAPAGGIVADAVAMPWMDASDHRAGQRADDLLTELGIGDVAHKRPSELPYPVQKRVALARALMSNPRLIMLDEPAGGIGADDMSELGELIRSWVPRRSVLLVEHHMELVMSVCDLIWVLDAGAVIASGSPAEVRSNPAVLAAYLGDEGAA